MGSSFDSFSSSSKDRLNGPNSFLSSPSPTSPSQYIPNTFFNPRTSPSRRVSLPRRSTSFHTITDHRQAVLHRVQAQYDNQHIVTHIGYFSPLYTDSPFGQSHPLPTLNHDNEGLPFLPIDGKFEAGGILDSPLVMRREEFSSPEKPLSPPLTLPLSTLTLPETDSECSFEDHINHAGSSSSSAEDDAPSQNQVGARKDTLSDENEETFSDLLQSEGMNLFQLSPLSTNWTPELSIVPENSTLLRSSPIASRQSHHESLEVDRPQSSNRSQHGSYKMPGFNSSPPWSPWSIDTTLPKDFDAYREPSSTRSDGFCSISDFDSYQPTRYLPPPDTDQDMVSPLDSTPSSGSDSLPTPVSPQKAKLSSDGFEPNNIWPPDASPSCPRPSHAYNRPFLEPLDIPKSSYHTPGSPDVFIPGLFDDDYPMDVDHEKQPPLPLLSSNEVDDTFFLPTPSSFAEPLPPPSSPSISKLGLPDLGADDSLPSSPSRRSFSSLPELESDDLPHPDFHPASPTQSLLSFPGADTDNDLLPPPPPNFSTQSPPPLPSSSNLLFIDDPRDVPLPRSPSPEDFDLDITLDVDSDMELMKLYSLHKKSLAAERAARYAEVQLIDAGSIVLRAEAAREKTRNKQRSKELGALLRIKLGDKIAHSSPDKNSSRGMISSISKLVARMIFRRHETFRPLAQRRMASTNNRHAKSPLSRYAEGDLGEAEF